MLTSKLPTRRWWCLASLSVVAAATIPQPVTAAERTDWFRQAGWGVMTHYLGAPPSSSGGAELTAEMWNRQIDAFDVEGLVGQVSVAEGWRFAGLLRRVLLDASGWLGLWSVESDRN